MQCPSCGAEPLGKDELPTQESMDKAAGEWLETRNAIAEWLQQTIPSMSARHCEGLAENLIAFMARKHLIFDKVQV